MTDENMAKMREAIVKLRAYAKSCDCDYQEECNPGTEEPCPSCKHVFIADEALALLDAEDKPSPEPAPSEQGEERDLKARAIVARMETESAAAHNEAVNGAGWLSDHAAAMRGHQTELGALLATRPQPESAKDLAELATAIYKIPAMDDSEDQWILTYADKAASLIQSTFEAWKKEGK